MFPFRLLMADQQPVEVTLNVERVPYRSAAWRELWRQIFAAVVEELDRTDAAHATDPEPEVMMGPVEHAIRATFRAPTTLRTLGQGKEFVLSEIDGDGIVLLLGVKRAHTRLSWECLESIPPFLQGQTGWAPVGGARRVGGEPGTLDEHLKRYVRRDVARWVVRVLHNAGVVDIANKPGLHVRLVQK